MSGPVDIMGVVAFPNENGKRDCRFIDTDYNTLFTVPDGENIVVNYLDGRSAVFPCRYLDDAHVVVGGRAYHIMELAETMQRQSAVSRPENPKEGDCCDYYEIYQLKTTQDVPYAFMPYESAKKKLNPSHYELRFRAPLAPNVSLDDLFCKHNRDDRPFSWRMHSMSVSDVIVTVRNGEKRAFYVDGIGFQEAKRFLNPQQKKRKRGGQER